jgi:nitrite reductase/ring-hydroxylating ferredoxin subunit
VPLLKATDIAPGDIIPVESNGQQLLLVADYDGSVYCVANVCPHLGTPLDQGSLGDGTIVCPLHKSAFSLESGELVGDWCPFPPVLGAFWPFFGGLLWVAGLGFGVGGHRLSPGPGPRLIFDRSMQLVVWPPPLTIDTRKFTNAPTPISCVLSSLHAYTHIHIHADE